MHVYSSWVGVNSFSLGINCFQNGVLLVAEGGVVGDCCLFPVVVEMVTARRRTTMAKAALSANTAGGWSVLPEQDTAHVCSEEEQASVTHMIHPTNVKVIYTK